MNRHGKAHLIKFTRNRSGAAAAEFAIIAPIFLLILFGMIAFGIYLSTAHSVQELAAGAARVAVAGINAKERQQLAEKYIASHAPGFSIINDERLNATIEDSGVDATQFVVRIEYDASDLPIYKLYSRLPVLNKTIIRSSTIQIGGV